MDFTGYDDAALDALRVDVLTEQERRACIASAPARADDVAEQYLRATGRITPDGTPVEWVQPTGSFDAYPMDATVLHGGKTWDSMISANVWEPGVSGWRERVEEGSAPAEFVQPTGAHDAYSTGDRVTFEGSVYESTIDANTYSPTDYPAGWKKVD